MSSLTGRPAHDLAFADAHRVFSIAARLYTQPMTNAWILLVVAGLLEVGWAIGLKLADGLNFRDRPLASSLTLAAMILSMALLAQAVRTIPVGTGYAIWTGIGAVGAAAMGILLFNEPATAPRLACLAMVVAGIIGLKLTSPSANAQSPAPAAPAAAIPFFIGTYTNGKSRGIYRATLDANTGAISEPKLVAETKNPSFLAIHPTRPVLYAVSEVGETEGKPVGGVKAYAIGNDGVLTQLSANSSEGDGPCYVSVDPQGQTVFVANYGSGSVASYPIDAKTGALSKALSIDQHVGSSVNAKRQEKAHAHCIVPDPHGLFVVSADLGMDSLLVYKLGTSPGTMDRAGEVKVAPGAGPRHIVFSSAAPFAYVITELANTVCAYAWNEDAGTLSLVETVEALPPGVTGESYTAEIAMHPSGRFLYGSNRGHDSIAVFGADLITGKLVPLAHTPTGGKWPRHFGVDPTGRFLIAANQRSDSLVVFRIDPDTGLLTPTGHSVEVGAPVCVRFLPTN